MENKWIRLHVPQLFVILPEAKYQRALGVQSTTLRITKRARRCTGLSMYSFHVSFQEKRQQNKRNELDQPVPAVKLFVASAKGLPTKRADLEAECDKKTLICWHRKDGMGKLINSTVRGSSWFILVTQVIIFIGEFSDRCRRSDLGTWQPLTGWKHPWTRSLALGCCGDENLQIVFCANPGTNGTNGTSIYEWMTLNNGSLLTEGWWASRTTAISAIREGIETDMRPDWDEFVACFTRQKQGKKLFGRIASAHIQLVCVATALHWKTKLYIHNNTCLPYVSSWRQKP